MAKIDVVLADYPEMRFTRWGKQLCTLYGDNDFVGQAWGEFAERIVDRYDDLSPFTRVAVKGQWKTRKWTDQNGEHSRRIFTITGLAFRTTARELVVLQDDNSVSRNSRR